MMYEDMEQRVIFGCAAILSSIIVALGAIAVYEILKEMMQRDRQ